MSLLDERPLVQTPTGSEARHVAALTGKTRRSTCLETQTATPLLPSDVWRSRRADGSIWTRVIKPRRFHPGSAPSHFLLCCCCCCCCVLFVSRWDWAGGRTTSDGLRLPPSYTSPALWRPKQQRNPQTTTPTSPKRLRLPAAVLHLLYTPPLSGSIGGEGS